MRQTQRTDNRASEVRSTAEGAKTAAWRGLARLLCGAVILHLSLTVTVFVLGRYALLPSTFDGNGVAVAFASDGARYRADAAALSEALKRDELRDWVGAEHPFHVKLYSICFALFGSWLGFNVVGAEPLNVLCYLATLVLVFSLGRKVCNRRAGLWAMVAVALWPSFLLHTTQFLKDPLFIAEMLALILVMVHWLTRNYSWPRALLTGAAGGLIATALWLTRADMGAMLNATVLLGAMLFVVRQITEGRVRLTNFVGMALVVAATLSVPHVIPNALELGRSPSVARARAEHEALRQAATEAAAHAPTEEVSQTHLWSRVAAHVGDVRRRFVEMYPDAGSNVDSDVQLDSLTDLLRYLPRAAVVGFFAPFPSMWFASGRQVGSAGRLLGGLESLAMYVVEGLALLGLWRGRRQLSVWFLFLVAAMGITALGLVVVNVGTLYRLRYVFLTLLIILAAAGAAHVLARLTKQPRVNRERGMAG